MKIASKKFNLLIIIMLSACCYAQDITIANGELLFINSSTNFYVNGLAFLPSADFMINGPNAISKTSTALDPQSINRVFTSNNLISDFQGTLTLFYDDLELNGVTESDLVLQVKDGSNIWNSLTGALDTSANTLSYTFGSTIDFSSVTASASGVTLAINKLKDFDIQLFPNPTTSKVYINSDFNVDVKVYNIIGEEILKSNEKAIDLSALTTGSYIFIIRNLENNTVGSYKILKF
jgi:hypothetical protein